MPLGALPARHPLAQRQRAAHRRRRGHLGLILLALAACADPGGGAQGPDRLADTADSAPVSDADTLLDALRADRDGALLDVSRATGWPAPVEDGFLFVHAEGGAWSLAGDHEGWAGEAMTEDAGFSWIVREIAGPGGYKYVAGDTWVADPWSRRLVYDEFGELSLVGDVTDAHLERHFQVESDTLAARTVRVWVPEGAATHVLYAHDGQNLFDPSASYGGWRVQDSVPDGMMVVGIDNAGFDRMDEYTHVEDVIDGTTYGGRAAEYGAYLQDVVRPLVDEVYGEPAIVGTMGSSLGGLISFWLADAWPDDFAFAASLSGTMGWGSIGAHNETLIERYAGAGHRGVALYLDSGGYGTTCADADGDGIADDDVQSADNYCENAQLRDVLAAEGYTFDVDLWHWHEPDATHDEAAWAERVWRPMEIFGGV